MPLNHLMNRSNNSIDYWQFVDKYKNNHLIRKENTSSNKNFENFMEYIFIFNLFIYSNLMIFYNINKKKYIII